MDPAAPRILVVDDEEINRAVLAAPLERQGWNVERAATAEEALARFRDAERERGFDVVLLDVHLPDGDGLHVMQSMRIATTPDERVPVILVTAGGGPDIRRRGLEAGADDFLSKPVDPHELVCRARTFVALRAAQRVLRQRAEQLEELQEARAELARLLVHDLKNPLAGVVTNLEYLHRVARRKDGVEPAELQSLEDARGASRRLLALVEGLVHVEQAETGQLVVARQTTMVRPLLEEIAAMAARDAADRAIAIEVEAAPALEASLDRNLVSRAVENLLANALRFARGGRVELRGEERQGVLEVSIANTGVGVAPEQRPHLFEKYKPRGAAQKGPHLGLGLYLCRRVAEAHGGSIALVDDPGWAARFVLRLPA